MKLDETVPYIDAALEMGVEQFSFTGGEPFVAKDFPKILRYAADRRPALVLTNATLPLIRRMKEVLTLHDTKYPIDFRVSIDYLDSDRHDAGRGQGSFKAAIEGIIGLVNNGFSVSIARQRDEGEDTPAVDQRYRDYFQELTGKEPPAIISFPDFKPPFMQDSVPEITENCMTKFHTPASRADFMCAYSRMIVKDNDELRVYACTLVDDDKKYDLGADLEASVKARVKLGHHRCYSCFAYGASCSQ